MHKYYIDIHFIDFTIIDIPIVIICVTIILMHLYKYIYIDAFLAINYF